MGNYQNKNKFIINTISFVVVFQIFYLLNITKSEEINCSRESPILISNECKLKYCTKAEFESNDCIINNSIIKTQWLNNIINFGELNYRYISFATYSTGDMIIETNSFTPLSKRIFLGLKKNGRPSFINKKNLMEETLFYSINVIDDKDSDHIIGILESESLVVRHNDTRIEYFLCISKDESQVELFDFWSDFIIYKTPEAFTGNKMIKSSRHSFFALYSKSNLNDYFYIFCFVGAFTTSKEKNNIFIQKHIFKGSNWKYENSLNKEIDEPNGYGEAISCFESESEFIICFFMTQIEDIVFLNLAKYDSNFENKKISNFSLSYKDEKIFIKSIHLKSEVGVFAYYEYFSDSIYPFLAFKVFNKDNGLFENYLPDSYNDSTVILQKYKFITNLLLNDLIQLTEKKLFIQLLMKIKKHYTLFY